jgi:hypothetical protein
MASTMYKYTFMVMAGGAGAAALAKWMSDLSTGINTYKRI